MSRVILEEQILTDIANAIREKNGEINQRYFPGEMAWAIERIDTSGGDTPGGDTPGGDISDIIFFADGVLYLGV